MKWLAMAILATNSVTYIYYKNNSKKKKNHPQKQGAQYTEYKQGAYRAAFHLLIEQRGIR